MYLVQQTAANYLEDEIGWRSVYVPPVAIARRPDDRHDVTRLLAGGVAAPVNACVSRVCLHPTPLTNTKKHCINCQMPRLQAVSILSRKVRTYACQSLSFGRPG